MLLAAAIVVPAVIGVVCHWALSSNGQPFLAQLGAIVTGAGSFLAAAGRWLRGQLRWVQDLRGRVEPLAREIDRRIEQQVEDQLVEQGRQIAQQIEDLDALKLAQTAAQSEKASATQEVQGLRAELARVGTDRSLRSFLDERLGGGEYQKRLGLAALVRRDFERLSRLLEQMTAKELAGELGDRDLVINRVVLYIDDLDRCESKKVVEVLRAVHLLLAFRAFVVVVAVDSRWIARCLGRHLEEVLVDDHGAGGLPRVTPLDYLEKIFQIPIWLEPASPEQRVDMARALLQPHRDALPGGPSTPHGSKPGAESGSRTGGATALPAAAPSASAATSRSPGAVSSRSAPAAPSRSAAASLRTHGDLPLELNPPGLEISDTEAAFLGELGELLSPSPRAIKRFVNTYRLINVGIARNGAPESDEGPHECEIRMLLLAILVAMPELSRVLQKVLREPPPGVLDPSLVAHIEEHFRASVSVRSRELGLAREAWARVKDWIDAHEDAGWRDVPAGRFARWLDPVGWYTFNLTAAPLLRTAPSFSFVAPRGAGGPGGPSSSPRASTPIIDIAMSG